MKVRWTPEAESDRLDVWNYLLLRDRAAAIRLDEAFGKTASALAEFPMMGHEGAVAGTREINPHRRYRLIYEVVNDTVWILALIHHARQWPPLRSAP